jgi:hypothetical protein
MRFRLNQNNNKIMMTQSDPMTFLKGSLMELKLIVQKNDSCARAKKLKELIIGVYGVDLIFFVLDYDGKTLWS